MSFNKKYIKQILKEVHPELQLTNDAYILINDILKSLSKKIVEGYESDNDYQKIISKIMSGKLAINTMKEWNNYMLGTYDLIYPLKSIDHVMIGLGLGLGYICNYSIKEFISVTIEYITLEILNAAGNITHNMKKIQINLGNVGLAIDGDNELVNLVSNVFRG